MKEAEYIEYLREAMEEGYEMAYGNGLEEAIYMIDDLIIYGGFCGGVRSIEHQALKHDDVSWEQIIEWGVLIVPETESYISEVKIDELDELGYERLPLESNHIVGWKGESSCI